MPRSYAPHFRTGAPSRACEFLHLFSRGKLSLSARPVKRASAVSEPLYRTSANSSFRTAKTEQRPLKQEGIQTTEYGLLPAVAYAFLVQSTFVDAVRPISQFAVRGRRRLHFRIQHSMVGRRWRFFRTGRSADWRRKKG